MLRRDLTLDLSCRKITDARLAHIERVVRRDPRFGELSVLHLFDNRITSAGMVHVCRLNPDAVTTLWLGHNRVRDDGVATLVATPWPRLTQLFLDDNYIGDDGATRLLRLEAVRRLGLHTNCLTAVGIERLRRRPYEVLWVHSQRPTR